VVVSSEWAGGAATRVCTRASEVGTVVAEGGGSGLVVLSAPRLHASVVVSFVGLWAVTLPARVRAFGLS
jgi:hypothetical protein